VTAVAVTPRVTRPARGCPGVDTHGPVVVISAGIGAGHDGAAAEITRRLRAAGHAVERHDFLDLLPAGWGAAIRGTYARQLAVAPASWGWLLDTMGRPRATDAASALSAAAAARRMLAAIPPAATAIVSTYPLAGQALGRLRLAGRLGTPSIAFTTDPWVHPLCVAPGMDLHLAPNAHATGRIRRGYGLRAATVSPVVDPRFRPARDAADVLAGRRRHGLPPAERLVLVVAGSGGVGDIGTAVRDIRGATEAIPVVVCGHNHRLRRRLAAAGQVVTLGWVDDMPSLLRSVDAVVHNAGGLTSLEAMTSGVPVISYRCLPGHGVGNAAVLRRIGLSAWPQSRDGLAAALRAALHGDLRQRQRRAYRRLVQARDAADLICEAAAPLAVSVAGRRPVATGVAG